MCVHVPVIPGMYVYVYACVCMCVWGGGRYVIVFVNVWVDVLCVDVLFFCAHIEMTQAKQKSMFIMIYTKVFLQTLLTGKCKHSVFYRRGLKKNVKVLNRIHALKTMEQCLYLVNSVCKSVIFFFRLKKTLADMKKRKTM